VTLKLLPIHDLEFRHSGLTKAIADCYTEAARICLDRFHEAPAQIDLESLAANQVVTADWLATDVKTQKAWANETDATEAGAYACALAAIEVAEGLVAVHRAETRTGADYYVAPVGTTVDDLEGCLRFEVSGVSKGSKGTVMQRLKVKLTQAASGASNLPAVAGVVGFEAKLIVIEQVE
jgi:hypothetical protein